MQKKESKNITIKELQKIKPSDEELFELAGDLSEVMDTTNRNCTYRPCGL